jgi:hypothetical protein
MRRLLYGLFGAALAVLGGVPAFAEAIEYVYTPLDLDKCRNTPGQVPGDGDWVCVGYGGIAVHVSASDERTFISYGAKAADEVAALETLRSFNYEGKIVEWRIARTAGGQAQPFATIMRWTTAVQTGNDSAGPKKAIERGQVLVVTRLGPGGVCHVGYADGRANPNANDLARVIADTRARGFTCGTDVPEISGKTGPGFSSRWVPSKN